MNGKNARFIMTRTQESELCNFEMMFCQVTKVPLGVGAQLNLSIDDDVIFIRHRKILHNKVIAVIDTYLPYGLCCHILGKKVERCSLHKLLGESSSTKIASIEMYIEAENATHSDVEILGVKPSDIVQQYTSIGFNSDGRKVEYSIERHLGGSFYRYNSVVCA